MSKPETILEKVARLYKPTSETFTSARTLAYIWFEHAPLALLMDFAKAHDISVTDEFCDFREKVVDMKVANIIKSLYL